MESSVISPYCAPQFVVQGVLNERGNYVVKPETNMQEIHIRNPQDIKDPKEELDCLSKTTTKQ